MKLGLLGRKLGHSYSPMIYEKMGLPDYQLFQKEPEEIEAFLHSGIRGCNVTIPYKKIVVPYLDAVDDLVKRLGSVNTIVRQPDGRLVGHNTDYSGFLSLVRRSGFQMAGKKVLVLGSGGASVTAVAVLEDLDAQIIVISRSGENNYENLSRHADAAYIVNTTPVGMYPATGSAPVKVEDFSQLEGVLDIVYNPARTQLMMDCETLNIPCFGGLWMLVAQARESAQWYTGNVFDDSVVEAIYRQLAMEMENLTLIGMAGCGKSTVGKLLAQRTGKKFVDADAEIEAMAQKTIPEIFAQDGEEVFRDWETKVLIQLGKQSGLVIATGGGCVTQLRNYPFLHQNSHIIWIQRSPEALPTDGRPLSQKTNPRVLYQRRKPLYAAFADGVVSNDGTVEETVEEILKVWEELQ